MNPCGAMVAAVFLAASLPAALAGTRPVEENFGRLHGIPSSTAGEAEITEERLRSHATWLASDENRGRRTAAGVLEGRVAEYIEAELRSLGLSPRGTAAGSSFRQPFHASSWSGLSEHSERTIDFGNPANFGHLPNSRGVAIGPDGKPVSVDPLPPGKLEPSEPNAQPNTFNLVALLEGTDPARKAEIVVVGAHMDHIGEARWGSGDRIYNGADDNASGTTALLAMARALARDRELGNGPARSVLFCFFSGEELGLLGSQFFAGSPTVEWARIKAMLNVDMIGRAQNGKVSVYDGFSSGGSSAPKGKEPNLFHRFHDTSSTNLVSIEHDIDGYLNRSDQYAFHRRGVPVAFFFEGFEADGRMNPDYHGRGDHADKLDIRKMQDITKFVYRHLLGVANESQGRDGE